MSMLVDVPVASVFTAALQGQRLPGAGTPTECRGLLPDGPVARARPTHVDHAVLAHCAGPDPRRGVRSRAGWPSRWPAAAAGAGHRRAARGRAIRRSARRARAPPQRLRPAARRGSLGHRPARRRQHRDRRRPGRAARARSRAGDAGTAGSSSTSRRRARVWSLGTSASRPGTAAAASSPGPSVGADAVAGRRARRGTGLVRQAPARRPLVRRPRGGVMKLPDVRALPRAVPRGGRLQLLAAQPGRHRTGRLLARDHLRPGVRHRADQPLGPDAVARGCPSRRARAGATASPRDST